MNAFGKARIPHFSQSMGKIVERTWLFKLGCRYNKRADNVTIYTKMTVEVDESLVILKVRK